MTAQMPAQNLHKVHKTLHAHSVPFRGTVCFVRVCSCASSGSWAEQFSSQHHAQVTGGKTRLGEAPARTPRFNPR